MKKKYYNKSTNEWYYEGTNITRKVEHGVFCGYPTEGHLNLWGFNEYLQETEDADNVDGIQNVSLA